MLKIKDNVNLKELEKFDIKKCGQRHVAFTNFKIPYLEVLEKRKIKVYADIGLDVLFDLITAGLVEKVVQ